MRAPRVAVAGASAPPAPGVAANPAFATRLVAWQREHGRNTLPWQDTRDAYRIWLSEIMLQQTQVSTATPYFLRFVARLPDVSALAAASIDEVLTLWAGLGYYRRAHHLHAAAVAVMRDHGGVFPADALTLLTLPGIGRSTAAAIAAFSSGERGAILDGNVKRVLARHGGIDGYPGDNAVAARLWAYAEALLPTAEIERYTQAMMDLGATVCVRLRPLCLLCPVMDDCVARREHRTDTLPAVRPRKIVPRRALQVLLVERGGEFLFERRAATGIWSGLWSLPEVAVDGDIAVALQVRFGATVARVTTLAPIEHAFTHFTLTLHPQHIAPDAWPTRAQMPGYVWLTRDNALNAALPAPIKRLMRSLQC